MNTLSLSLQNDPKARCVLVMDPLDNSNLLREHHSISVDSPSQYHNVTPSSAVLLESPSANCPLLSLPPELRLRIYDEVSQVREGRLYLTPFNGSWYRTGRTEGYEPKTRNPSKCVGLLATCKQIFAEAHPLLCARTTLALYDCDSNSTPLGTPSVDLTNIIPKAHKIHINIKLYAPHDLDSEEIRTMMAPFVEVTNNALVARELRIELTISLLREQEYFDRVMLCFGDIESNAKTFIFLTTTPLSKVGLNDASFTNLLKKLSR